MPSSIELNIGHVPSPRRTRGARDDGGTAPFRIVVLGDFSSRPAGERAPLGERRTMRVDIDNLDAQFARLAPKVEIVGLQDKFGVALHAALETLDDFGADAVLARLPADTVARVAAAAPAPAPVASAPVEGASADGEDAAATLRRLLGGSVPDTAPARSAPAPASVADKANESVERFIRQLVSAAPAAPQPAPAAAATSNDAAAALLREVLRDPAWRHLECAWRSVDRFVRELDMADGSVRLELLDCRADELLADLVAVGADPARCALAAALKGDGRGCAVVVSLEEFGAGVSELSLLGGLASVAAAHGAVLLAGAAPTLVAVATSEDAAVRASTEARVWHALRASALAPAVGLTFPRLLARLPYGPRNDPVSAFAFDELADASGAAVHDRLLWRSAALDAALLLAQGVAEAGGLDGAESRVQLDDLPAFIDRSGDEPRLQAVAEAYFGERDVRVLQDAGFITIQSDRRVPSARVSGWQSIAGGGLLGCWRAD
jgi:type VI secretion system protein ImpC